MKEGTLAFWPKITVTRYTDLLETFVTLDSAFSADLAELKKLPWKPEIVVDFYNWKKSAEEISAPILEQFFAENISILIFGKPGYPKLLAKIFDPPFALFVKGNLASHKPALAVVGSRRASEYGRNVVKEIIPQVSAAGISIVSGLANGIDSAAHEAALRGGGHTVAVLGFGIGNSDLDHSKPKQKLAQKILESDGAIISEYLPGVRGNEFTFPKRNRIIAGLCKGTLVIEATIGSGALITADCAAQNHREIMAIPHSIFSTTGSGVNNLFKEAAHPITCTDDIFLLYGLTKKSQTALQLSTNTPEEQEIISTIRTEPKDRDNLSRELKIPIFQLATLLTNLEIQGIIKVKNNQYHVSD